MPDWWRCPNNPACAHAAAFHDIEDLEDEIPRCCVEGCRCGARPSETGTPATEESTP